MEDSSLTKPCFANFFSLTSLITITGIFGTIFIYTSFVFRSLVKIILQFFYSRSVLLYLLNRQLMVISQHFCHFFHIWVSSSSFHRGYFVLCNVLPYIWNHLNRKKSHHKLGVTFCKFQWYFSSVLLKTGCWFSILTFYHSRFWRRRRGKHIHTYSQ